MIIDDLTGKIRRGNIQDAVKMYQLAKTCDLYESINSGVVDPEGNDSEDQYISQIAMMLINLTALVEEEQDITIFPCTLSFMTGPESLLEMSPR